MVQYAAVQNHYGDNYVAEINSDDDIEFIEEVCEICFESDWVFGVFDTEAEAKRHLKLAK